MSFVYRIDKHDSTWHVVYDQVFSSLSEARDYVINKNRNECSDSLELEKLPNIESISNRCTDEQWSHKRKYFIGKPDTLLIQMRLIEDNIEIPLILDDQRARL